MIVVKSQILDQDSDLSQPHLEVVASGGGYTVIRRNDGDGPSITLRSSDLQPWDRKVFYWSYYGDGFVSPPHYENSRDADAFMRSRFGVRDVSFVAARGGNDELVIVTRSPTITSLPFSAYTTPGPVIEAIDSALPGFKASRRAAVNKAKRDLLAQVNPVDKIAELEKQIDLLAKVVEALAQDSSASMPNWFPQLKSIVDAHSAVAQRGEQAALDEIQSGKANMRALQAAYFAVKYAN